MKRLAFAFFTAISLSSCAVVSTLYTMADVTLMNDEGESIRKWDNATIEVSSPLTDSKSGGIKSGGGLYFYDENGKGTYINGGIILAENFRTVTSKQADVSSTRNQRTPEEEKLIEEYIRLRAQIEQNDKAMKDMGKAAKDSPEYQIKVEQNGKMKARMKEIDKELSSKYHNFEPRATLQVSSGLSYTK